jgi:exopolysaccharide biosynthesis predicted pyruvyltransferase EpsI
MNIVDFVHKNLWWIYRPLKDAIKEYVDRYYRKQQIERFKCLSADDNHVFYLGITEQPNLGDMAQYYCIKKWIEENYPDRQIVMFESSTITDPKFTSEFFYELKKVFRKDDFIVIQSGYCTQDLGGDHPLMHRLVCDYMSSAKILMMPQTVFFKNEENKRICAENHNKARNMLFLARDLISYETALRMFPNIRVAAFPDIVTTLIGKFHFNNQRDGICLCIRNDGEKFYNDDEILKLSNKIKAAGIHIMHKDTQGSSSYRRIRANIKTVIKSEIETYSHFKVTITDRYHGTIFSLCASTPVIIIRTKDHKVISGADWFKGVYDDYIYVAENLDEAYNIAKHLITKTFNNNLAPFFKEHYYDKLKSIFESDSRE